MEGWIKLHRCIQDNPVWTAEPFTKGQAWVDLLLLAYFDERKVMEGNEIVVYERGTVNHSIKFLADRWGWSRHKVSDFLNLLERDNMLIQNRTSKRTYLNLVNYSIYQDVGTPSRTSKGHQKDTNKEIKELKNKKRNIKEKNPYLKTDYDFTAINQLVEDWSKEYGKTKEL